MRYSEIKNKIQKNYENLPRNQKRIADFFIDNFDRIPFLNVQDISQATESSVASVVRFAQRIGFSGFSEMRDDIANTLQDHLENNEIFPLIENFEEDSLTYVANQDVKNINESLTLVDRQNFSQAVDLFLAAKRVYTGGLGISYLLAQILAYQLTQVGIDAHSFRKGSASFAEQALYLNDTDLVAAFSFPPYSSETIDLVKSVRDKGIQVVSITNRYASPITLHSTVSLVVKSENLLYTNSFAAISVLINAIATECALRDKPRAERMLHHLNELMENQSQSFVME